MKIEFEKVQSSLIILFQLPRIRTYQIEEGKPKKSACHIWTSIGVFVDGKMVESFYYENGYRMTSTKKISNSFPALSKHTASNVNKGKHVIEIKYKLPDKRGYLMKKNAKPLANIPLGVRRLTVMAFPMD